MHPVVTNFRVGPQKRDAELEGGDSELPAEGGEPEKDEEKFVRFTLTFKRGDEEDEYGSDERGAKDDATAFEVVVSKTEFGYMAIAVTAAQVADKALLGTSSTKLRCFTNLNDYASDTEDASLASSDRIGREQDSLSVKDLANKAHVVRVPFTREPLFFVRSGDSEKCSAGSFVGVSLSTRE